MVNNEVQKRVISAIVLLNTNINAQYDVLENVKQIGGVQVVHSLFGVYDLLVKVKADSIDELKNITKSPYKTGGGVTSSLTLMIDDHEDIHSLRPSLF